jgi:hypothetical protein
MRGWFGHEEEAVRSVGDVPQRVNPLGVQLGVARAVESAVRNMCAESVDRTRHTCRSVNGQLDEGEGDAGRDQESERFAAAVLVDRFDPSRSAREDDLIDVELYIVDVGWPGSRARSSRSEIGSSSRHSVHGRRLPDNCSSTRRVRFG